MTDVKWYKGIVQKGDKQGRTIGFPTINLDPLLIDPHTKKGVYKVLVLFDNKTYIGALYFGLRMVKKEQHDVLEIYILDFKEEIYGKKILFCIGNYIRKPLNFNTLYQLQNQLKEDINTIKHLGGMRLVNKTT